MSVTSEHNIVFHDAITLETKKQMIGHNDEIIDIKYLHKGSHIVVVTNSPQVSSVQLQIAVNLTKQFTFLSYSCEYTI